MNKTSTERTDHMTVEHFKPFLVEEMWETYAAIVDEVDERLPDLSDDEVLGIAHREFHERYAISRFFDRSGWRLASCELAGRDGPFNRSGYYRLGLFIHFELGQELGEDRCVVSHAATGRRHYAFAGRKAFQAALAFGDAVVGLVNWEQIASHDDWEKRTDRRQLGKAIRQAAAISAETTQTVAQRDADS